MAVVRVCRHCGSPDVSNAKGPPGCDACHAANKRKLQIEALDRIRADPERNAERLAAQRSYYWREGKQRGVETRRLRVYAMSPEAYAELFTRQRGLCAICHKPERCRARGSLEPGRSPSITIIKPGSAVASCATTATVS